MEKTILLIGLIAVLFGCTQLEVKDCGTDLDCFNESIMKGEKAKVKYTEETELHGNTIPNQITIIIPKNSSAEIISCDKPEDNPKAFEWPTEFTCTIHYTNLKSSINNISSNWKKAECEFVMNTDLQYPALTGCKEIK